MRAVTFQGAKDIKVKNVSDPKIEKHDDILVKVTSTAICGSDLHIYLGAMPTHKDYVIGHEPMGIVEEVGPNVTKVKKGDRVVIPFNIACGHCFYCDHEMESQCDNSNPNAEMAAKVMGHSPSGLFGFSHMLGGFPGGQAEYLRVPFADVGPLKIESDLPDEKVVFLSDIFPTGYHATELAGVMPGESVVIYGAGPVGLIALDGMSAISLTRSITSRSAVSKGSPVKAGRHRWRVGCRCSFSGLSSIMMISSAAYPCCNALRWSLI